MTRTHRTHRTARITLAAAAAATFTSPAAHAAPKSWAAPATGDWTANANWSPAAAPTSADDVLINLPGPYTVRLNATNRSARTLTLDAPNATLGLAQFGSASLTLSELLINSGTLLFGQGTSTLTVTQSGAPGTLTNHGTITGTATGSFNLDPYTTIQATIVNTGTIQTLSPPGTPDWEPVLKFTGSVTNAGSISAAPRSRIRFDGPSFNQNAGSISGRIDFNGPTFNFNAGTVDHVFLTSATLNVSPAAGPGTFLFRGPGNTLAGSSLAPGSFLNLTGASGDNPSLTLPATYTNNARILVGYNTAPPPGDPVPHLGTAYFAPTLNLGPAGSGTLTNNGTLELNSPVNYPTTLNGQITNNANITINAPSGVSYGYNTTLNGSWTNNGNVTLAPSFTAQLTPGSSFTHNAGTLSIGAASQLELRNASFNFNGGNTTGWVLLTNSTLNIVPAAGTGYFLSSSTQPATLAGDIPATAAIHLSPSSFGSGRANASSFTNAGTLATYTQFSLQLSLDNGAGILTNTGNIDGAYFNSPSGTRFRITGSLHNTGSIRSNSLVVSGNLHHDAGTISVPGVLVVGGDFHHTGGTITGNPITLNNSSLHLAPGVSPAAFTFVAFAGSLTGNIPAGGSISLSPASSVPSQTVTATAPLTNSGTITLSPKSTLSLPAPFSNPGTITLSANSTLLLTYTSTSPADDIRTQLLTGHLAPSTPSPTHRLAYLDTGSSLLVQLTLTGDTNLDGLLNADDYTPLDRSLALSLTNAFWTDGDFNYDGIINHHDYLLLDTAYTKAHGLESVGPLLSHRQSQFGPDYVSTLLTSIPEPTLALSSILYPLSSLILTRRRTQPHSKISASTNFPSSTSDSCHPK